MTHLVLKVLINQRLSDLGTGRYLLLIQYRNSLIKQDNYLQSSLAKLCEIIVLRCDKILG